MQSAFSIVKILVLEVSGFVLSEVSVQTEIVQNILFHVVTAYIRKYRVKGFMLRAIVIFLQKYFMQLVVVRK